MVCYSTLLIFSIKMKDLLKNVKMSPQDEIVTTLYVVKSELSEKISESIQLLSLLSSYRLNNLSEFLAVNIISNLKKFEDEVMKHIQEYAKDVTSSEEQSTEDKPTEEQSSEETASEDKPEETKVCPECESEIPVDAIICPECEYDFNSSNEKENA